VIWTWAIDSVLAVAAETGIDRLLVACSGRHERFYARLGFGIVPGARKRQAAVSPPPPELRPRIDMLRARLRAKGFTCCCATYPECLGAPYATGRFGDVDLFCPVRAAEIG